MHGALPYVAYTGMYSVAYTYPFSIQFLQQTADSFALIITQFVEYG